MTESAKLLLEEFNKTEVPISPYKRGPNGKDVFSIAKDGNKSIKIWAPDDIGYQLSVDKKYNQGVLTVKEPRRKVKNAISAEFIINLFRKSLKGGHEKDNCYKLRDSLLKKAGKNRKLLLEEFIDILGSYDDFKEEKTMLEDHIDVYKNSLYVFVPNSVFSADSIRIEYYNSYEMHFEILGVSKTRSTKTTFLIGIDEERPFISVLKKHVNTVKQAHDELKPSGLKAGYKRQGEWFFIPVSKKMDIELTSKFMKQPRSYHLPYEGFALEQNSSHRSSFVMHHDKKKYVRGKIRDTRKGMHAPLYLKVWHEVIRNNEVKVEPTVRNYD